MTHPKKVVGFYNVDCSRLPCNCKKSLVVVQIAKRGFLNDLTKWNGMEKKRLRSLGKLLIFGLNEKKLSSQTIMRRLNKLFAPPGTRRGINIETA